jgi:uncharacterized membrane protein YeaQ/YmgE (transglycosylase-associated protein family)
VAGDPASLDTEHVGCQVTGLVAQSDISASSCCIGEPVARLIYGAGRELDAPKIGRRPVSSGQVGVLAMGVVLGAVAPVRRRAKACTTPWGAGRPGQRRLVTSGRRHYHLTVILGLFLLLVGLFVVLPIIGMPGWAIISTIIVGFIIGALGRLVVPGRQRVNLVVTFLAGLVGSIVGGFLGSHVFGLGWIGTTLVEIGLAAAVIVFMVSRGGRRLVRGR